MWIFKRGKVRTVFFDIGGVVVDAPMEHYEDIGCDIFACQKEHLRLCAAEFIPLLEKGKLTSVEFWESVGQKLAAKEQGQLVPGWRFKGLWKGILLDTLKINKEVLDIAHKLSSKVRISVLSNTIAEHALILKQHGVYQKFNPVVLSYQVGMRKPEPEVYPKAAKLAGCKPANCLLIDDLMKNLEGAKKAGFQAIHYRGDVNELYSQLRAKALL